MARKNSLATIRNTMSVAELHSVSRETALLAANREVASLEEALEIIDRAKTAAEAVFSTTASVHARHEIVAAAVALSGAVTHLGAAIKSITSGGTP